MSNNLAIFSSRKINRKPVSKEKKALLIRAFCMLFITFFMYSTKFWTNNYNSLDICQEFLLFIFFLKRLKVSGVMPSIEAMYCNGTYLNISGS